MTGLHLSHYAIESELGRGGMGIVYRARDTKLNRTVALKVLPASALASPDDRARFQREAQSAAQLNHPNVCHVYQVDEAVPLTPEGKAVEGQTEARLFIAMEFIEGETLHDYVRKGPLQLQEAINIAGQVAEALKEAHAKDIVHRDIKSANIMFTEGGVAKVLDFGLAKTNQSTMLTRMGSTLGTVAYMSPEQARGQEVDGRSDLYSLGTMLYEMVAGRLPYSGDYEQAVIYGILNEAPEPLTAVRTGVPMQLEWVVNKLLAKEAEYRYQSAAGLLADLKSLDLSGSGLSQRGSATATAATAADPAGGVPGWVWGVIAFAFVGGLAASWLLKPSPVTDPDTVVRRLQLEIPGVTSATWPSVSADGSTLVFSASDSLDGQMLMAMELSTGEMRVIADHVTWRGRLSPDGTRIAYQVRGELYTRALSSSTPLRVGDETGFAAWMPDGGLVYSERGAIWLRPASGGESRQITFPDSVRMDHAIPHPLPGGRNVLYGVRTRTGPGEVWVVDAETGATKKVVDGARAHYVPSGHLLYGPNRWGGAVYVRAFDAATVTFVGPEAALRDVLPENSFTFDRHGVYYEVETRQSVLSSVNQLYRLAPDGSVGPALTTGPHERPRLSPEGRRIAFNVEGGEEDWLEILDLESGVSSRITFSGDVDNHAWASDGNSLVIDRDGVAERWSTSGGLLETLPISPVNHLDLSPDGTKLVYVASPAGFGPLRVYDLDSGEDSLLESGNSEFPRFSPDGRFVAYTQDIPEGFVTFVRAVDGSGVRTQLSMSQDTGTDVVWSRDGSHLFVFVRSPLRIFRVPVDIRNGFVQLGPGELYHLPAGLEGFDTAADGSLYVMADSPTDEVATGNEQFQVTVNWFDYLKEIAPRVR